MNCTTASRQHERARYNVFVVVYQTFTNMLALFCTYLNLLSPHSDWARTTAGGTSHRPRRCLCQLRELVVSPLRPRLAEACRLGVRFGGEAGFGVGAIVVVAAGGVVDQLTVPVD